MAGSTHRATIENGPNVVGGKLVWTSATGITTADHNSYGGCLRRWFYEQVLDEKGPPTKAMLGGSELHGEIENHLRTGARLQTPLALAGAVYIPQPGGNLSIERPIHFQTKTGVDIYGHVDLYNFRQEYIDETGMLQRDPSWSFEVKDWKTTADFQYAKTAAQLATNIQLVTYSEAGFRFAPDMEHARHTHVYFRTRGAPASKLVTVLNHREEIAARWEYAESVVRSMADVARETAADAVPGNRQSCDAYRGCPHRAKCSVFKHNSLDSLFAKIAGDHVRETQLVDQLERTLKVGILADNPAFMQQGAQPAPVTQQQLAQEEQQLRAQAAQQQQQMPMTAQQGQTAAGADLLAVCYRLSQYGFGFPKLVGNAAQAYAAASGQNVAPGFEFPGVMANVGATRSLHTLPLSEVAHIYQLDSELAAERNKTTPPAPPQAYAPAQVGVMVQDQAAQTAPVPPQFVTQAYAPVSPGGPLGAQFQQAPSLLPPNAPPSMPQLAQQMPAAPATEAPVAAPKKPRGRPKNDSGTAPEAAPSASHAPTAAVAFAPPSQAPAPQVTPVAAPTSYANVDKERGAHPAVAPVETGMASGGSILVNSRFSHKTTKSLAGYVDYVNSELAKRYSIGDDGKPGIQDVRCVPKTSPLAYGGWKGAVREVVKADPPPQGDYHLDTFMDELNEAVADALRVVAEAKGWLYVRGIR